MLNRSSRQDEITAQKTADLIKGMGEQIDRLRRDQQEDRDQIGVMSRRIATLEQANREQQLELWDEQNTSRKLRRALVRTVDDLDDAWEWIDSNHAAPPPARPNLVRVRSLLDTPRPRRPPDPDNEKDST